MNRLASDLGILITFLFVTCVAPSTAYATDQPELKRRYQPHKIVGLWDVEVIVEDCETGDPLGDSFIALHQFDLGGTGQVVPATNPTLLSAHMTVWRHLRRNDYQQTIKFFRFDETGIATGWTVIRNKLTLNKAGNEYFGSGVAEIYDLDGNLLFSACPSPVGIRFTGK